MMLIQAVLAAIAIRWRDRRGAIAAALLAAACLLSAVSGFFDGALGADELSAALTACQVFLIVVTAGVGALSAVYAVALVRPRLETT